MGCVGGMACAYLSRRAYPVGASRPALCRGGCRARARRARATERSGRAGQRAGCGARRSDGRRRLGGRGRRAAAAAAGGVARASRALSARGDQGAAGPSRRASDGTRTRAAPAGGCGPRRRRRVGPPARHRAGAGATHRGRSRTSGSIRVTRAATGCARHRPGPGRAIGAFGDLFRPPARLARTEAATQRSTSLTLMPPPVHLEPVTRHRNCPELSGRLLAPRPVPNE